MNKNIKKEIFKDYVNWIKREMVLVKLIEKKTGHSDIMGITRLDSIWIHYNRRYFDQSVSCRIAWRDLEDVDDKPLEDIEVPPYVYLTQGYNPDKI